MTVQPCFVDLYNQDDHGDPDIATLIAAGDPWNGIILKATEGKNWSQGPWLAKVVAECLKTDRLGASWFLGAYHYVHFMEDPITQVDFFFAIMKAAGIDLTKPGILWPMLDVERADNPDCSAQQIISCVTAMANEIAKRTGKKPTLYGGSLMYDKSIVDQMGCGRLMIPRYTPDLPAVVYKRIGWPFPGWWQYGGTGADEKASLPGYPSTAPGLGQVDLSAYVAVGGLQQIAVDLAA